MPEITAEKVADFPTEGDNDFHEDLDAWPSLRVTGNVVEIKMTPADYAGEEDEDNITHFRAVVVEGEDTPIVLERPDELGITWEDNGSDLLALTNDGIRLHLRGMDEWELDPAAARELAAHLAAMADAYEAAQGEAKTAGGAQ
ncbi:hypothetical protein [Streptosporangium sandarakinum]